MHSCTSLVCQIALLYTAPLVAEHPQPVRNQPTSQHQQVWHARACKKVHEIKMMLLFSLLLIKKAASSSKEAARLVQQRREDEEERTWLKAVQARGSTGLTRARQMSNAKWVNCLQVNESSLLQVGAHTHDSNYIQGDVVPAAVQKGWKSILLEPIPHLFARLTHRYHWDGGALQLVPRAVCRSCADKMAEMHYIEASNASGNWGSDHADVRCLDAAVNVTRSGRTTSSARWAHEIASLGAHPKCDPML